MMHDNGTGWGFNFKEIDWYPLITTTNGANFEVVHIPKVVADCDHPLALLQVTDNMAICDGCGRTFELKQL